MSTPIKMPKIYLNNEGPFTGLLSVTVQQVEVTALSKPDPGWWSTDEQGHYHAYDKDLSVPTLELASHGVVMTDEGETYQDVFHRCVICHEEIHPGSMSTTFREFRPGATWYQLKVLGIPSERAVQWMEARQSISVRCRELFGTASIQGAEQITDARGQTTTLTLDVFNVGTREQTPGWTD